MPSSWIEVPPLLLVTPVCTATVRRPEPFRYLMTRSLAGESNTRRCWIRCEGPRSIVPITITFAAATCCARVRPAQLACVAVGARGAADGPRPTVADDEATMATVATSSTAIMPPASRLP